MLTTGWPYRPGTAVMMPAVPQISGVDTYSIDFNRHGKRDVGNAETDPSTNLLYADGYASTASAREVYRAMFMR